MPADIKRVCVYCGSGTGHDSRYAEQARALGKGLASRGIELVYGGGSIGLMNVVADAVLNNGVNVHGVIPENLMISAHSNLTALHVTNTMHERKAMMMELSDAFIALPGGFGTIEELLETVTWFQLKLHAKPVIILNMEGYYDKLIEFLDHAVREGFLRKENRELLYIATSVVECLSLLRDK